jgi:hypothetical protein
MVSICSNKKLCDGSKKVDHENIPRDRLADKVALVEKKVAESIQQFEAVQPERQWKSRRVSY